MRESKNLPQSLPLPLLFFLSFLKGICCCPCPCFSSCHSRRKSAVALALAFLSVIPEGNLLLPLLFFLSFLKGICCCPCFSFCHSCRESAVALAVAFLSNPKRIRHPERSVAQPKDLRLSLPSPLLLSGSHPRDACVFVAGVGPHKCPYIPAPEIMRRDTKTPQTLQPPSAKGAPSYQPGPTAQVNADQEKLQG